MHVRRTLAKIITIILQNADESLYYCVHVPMSPILIEKFITTFALLNETHTHVRRTRLVRHSYRCVPTYVYTYVQSYTHRYKVNFDYTRSARIGRGAEGTAVLCTDLSCYFAE